MALTVRYNLLLVGEMRRLEAIAARAWMALVPAALFFATSLRPQEVNAPVLHVTTQERLETEPWWPTMTSAPLQAYAGSNSCAGCHAEKVSPERTGMQRAATRSGEARLFSRHPPPAFVSGGLKYSLTQDGTSLQLSVSSGNRKATQTVDWDFGAGDLAHTFLYQANGRWFQSGASLYTHLSALDITTGFGANTGNSPAIAIGNALSASETRTCFGCHTVHATTSAGLEPLHAEAGIGCEACHGPGRQHVTNMDTPRNGEVTSPAVLQDSAIFQPGKLSPSDSIDFCGSCHRSFADAKLSSGPQADIAVVRFQPYRLEESKCWRATQDERLTCVACHDPHRPLNRDPASYDRNCLQCHAGVLKDANTAHAAPVCPKATHACVTCHMPKVEIASMHGSFTDHFIRIAREGEALPR